MDTLADAARVLGNLSNLTQNTPTVDLPALRNPHLQREARKSQSVKGTTQILRGSISVAQQLERVLVDIRHDMQTRLDTLQTALAPISTLPPEVLRQIFLLVLPEPGMVDPNTYASVASISKVSRIWRTVALDQSALWTQIHAEWSIPLQNLWLSRARHQLLHIVAICLCASRREMSRVGLSRVLWASSNNWASLSVYNFGQGDLQLLVRPALCGERGLMNLQSVALVAGDDEPEVMHGFGAFVDAHPYRLPIIQRLQLSGVRMPALFTIAPTITELELSHVVQTLDGLDQLLRACAGLEILALTKIGLPAADTARLRTIAGRSQIALPRLRELHYTAQHALSFTHTFLFFYILAPNLRSLCLNTNTPFNLTNPPGQSYYGVAKFIQNSPLLERLTLLEGSRPINETLLRLGDAIHSSLNLPVTPNAPKPREPMLLHLTYLKIDVADNIRCFCGGSWPLQYDFIHTNLQYFLSVLLAAKRLAPATQGAVSTPITSAGPRGPPAKALEKLVIADCPVTQLGWIKSRVSELRYVKRACGAVRDAWGLMVARSDDGDSEMEDYSEEDPESDVDVESSDGSSTGAEDLIAHNAQFGV